jgi:putative addiction module component (TIGR02574 family)
MGRELIDRGHEDTGSERELTDREKEMLDQRLESYRRDPKAASPWEAVKKRILDRASQPGS